MNMNSQIDFTKILAARNKNKLQVKSYLHEAEHIVAAAMAEKLLGKKSASLFVWASTCLVLGKLGCKFDFMSDGDRLIITKLHRAITHNW
jgi:hypothetical protein